MEPASPFSHSSDLRALARHLLSRCRQARTSAPPRIQKLEDAVRDAQAWLFRRASKVERDKRCYRLGAAFESQGGLDIDDVFLCGMDQLGGHGLTLLAAVSVKAPADAYLNDLLRILARTPSGRAVREWGVWARWYWLRALYEETVEHFINSPKGRDPAAGWRKAPATRKQTYLAMEIARCLTVVAPAFANGGEAHEWLKVQGGNPRFKTPPPLPPLPTAEELGL